MKHSMQKSATTGSVAARSVEETSRSQRRWGDTPWVVLLAVLPLLVLLPAATGRGVFFYHDIQYYFYPYHIISANMARAGQWPLWNPYAFSGIPLVGDGQTAMFYPPNWLFFMLPGAAALNYTIILQFSIAGVGSFLFARSLGLGRAPALIAALAYMFCGFLTARVVHLSIQSGAALVPWLFLCVERSFRTNTGRWFALAAVAVGLQAVSGHPQVPIYTALGLGLFALVRGWERWQVEKHWRSLFVLPVRLAGMYLLGYALAAIQLVPWVELGMLSPRAAGASFDFVFGNSMGGTNWLLFLFPYLYGSLGTGLYGDTPARIKDAVALWEHSAYVGMLPLGLAMVALIGLKDTPWRYNHRSTGDDQQENNDRRRSWFTLVFFTLLLVIALLMAAGKYTPLGQVIYITPVVGKLRDVERVLVLAAFALSMLAAIGSQALIEGRPLTLLGVRRATVAVAAVLVIVPALTLLIARSLAGQTAGALPLELANLSLSRPNAYVPLLLAVAAAALLIVWPCAHRRLWAGWVAVALVFADVGISYAAFFNPVTDPQLYNRVPEVAHFLQQDPEPFRKATLLNANGLPNDVAQETLAVSWSMVYGIEDVNGFNSLQPRRYTDYLFSPELEDVSYGYLVDERLLRPDNPVLSTLNVKYVLIPYWQQPVVGEHLRLVFENRYVRVYENTRVLPRAFFADSVRVESDPRVVLQTVTAPGYNSRDALIETDALPPLPQPTGAARVDIVQRSPNTIELRTTTADPRLLVLSEMDIPGWRALVDGVETPIYTTNYLFRGVVVPAGEHTISFVYGPRSVLFGAGISAVALLAIVVLIMVRRNAPVSPGVR